MPTVFKCRRTVVSLYAITCLTFLCYTKGAEAAAAISTIALGLSAANAWQNKTKKEEPK